MINAFLDWAQEQDDGARIDTHSGAIGITKASVWIVSNEQLLDWVQNAVAVSQLDKINSLKCSTPQVDPSLQICNGIPQNEDGLLQRCPFSDFPFYTCYGCPTFPPTPSNPNPPQAVPSGESPRYHIPANCSTPFWDPINGKCICTASSCSSVDDSRPIGPNGANLTGGGIGAAFTSDVSPMVTYVPFNGAARAFSPGLSAAVLLGPIMGAAAVMDHL